MNRRGAQILILIILTSAVGCTSYCTVAMPDVSVTSDQMLGGTDPLPVLGYTDREGKYHRFRGFVAATPPDTLVFTMLSKSSTFGTGREETVRVSIADIESIKFKSSAPLAGRNARSE